MGKVKCANTTGELLSPLSESVHLDRGPRDSLFDKEVGNLGALVSLELDDLTGLFVVDKCAVASEFLHARSAPGTAGRAELHTPS